MTVETVVKTTTSLHSYLEILTTLFVVATNKGITVEVKVFPTTYIVDNFFILKQIRKLIKNDFAH